jgi:hypothetical protein
MSDLENPYASPKAESIPENDLITRQSLTDTMTVYLREAAPWLRFIGIVGYIGCGFLAVLGIASIAGMNALSGLWDSISELGSMGSLFNSAFSITFGFNFLLTAVLCFFPSRFIWNFGSKLRSYFQNGREQELELALKNNKSLWKFLGIITIINLSMIPVLIVIVIITAVVSVFA